MMFMLKFIILFFFVGNFIYSQVGIGTTDPKSSLDIYQQTGNNPQGVLIPRLSGDALKAMSLSLDQHSMLVYSLSAANSRMGTVAELIDSEGYYYYDFSINRFVKLCNSIASSSVTSVKTSNHEDLVPEKQMSCIDVPVQLSMIQIS